MGIIILDPDPPPSGPKGKRAVDSLVAIEPNGKWQIVLNDQVLAEFEEYDDAVRYLGHIDPLGECHKHK